MVIMGLLVVKVYKVEKDNKVLLVLKVLLVHRVVHQEVPMVLEV